MRKFIILLTIFCTSLLINPNALADNHTETYTLTGSVYDFEGNPADSTSIKVDSMNSLWSENGSYEFSGITYGEHTVRAYFMNNGHTVVYRKMFFESDMQLDWHEGKNWITAKMYDSNGNPVGNSSTSTVKLIEMDQSNYLHNGWTDFGPYNIGDYFTARAYFGDIDHSTQYVHFKLQPGSSALPDANHFEFHHGKNSRYGYVSDENGSPMADVIVSSNSKTTVTNIDGFYLLQNLDIGTNQTFTFTKGELEIADPVTDIITTGESWMNISSSIEVILPDSPFFITQVQALPVSNVLIEWQGGNNTDYYSLYEGDNLLYRGNAKTFDFNPQNPGTFEFVIESTNSNGTVQNNQTLIIIILPEQSDSDLWSTGMSWNYAATYVPESMYGTHNKTMTAVGTESIVDAFGVTREAYLVRMSDEHDFEGEKSYRWIDSENLLTLHTYWVDAPSQSSYFQEGTLGWNITDQNGEKASFFGNEQPLNLHFNRTNVIGVPGHPNGYDDTHNTISITNNVQIETIAGTFDTTYIAITDNIDGVLSWELWYNETVRNWVKIIDRLPGSHSDSSTYELTGYNVPTNPQFTTENYGNYSVRDYNISWANFQGASNYQLLQNGEAIYEGESLSLEIIGQADGAYEYQINAIMASGHIIEGGIININIDFKIIPPELMSSKETIIENDQVSIYWNKIDNAIWYSLTVQNENGTISEIYNGTELATTTNQLELGINRLRIKAANTDGKVSELSNSIFINVEEQKVQDENSIPHLSTIATLVTFIMACVIIAHRRNGE